MAPFDLATYGDSVERVAWPSFVCREFPQYEEFWQVFVVELTERVREPLAVEFRPQEELNKISRPAWHIAVAQLHYTTLLDLVRVFELRRRGVGDRDSFTEAIARLQAGVDAAFELLGRCLLSGGDEQPWSEKKGESIRRKWQKAAGDPLKSLRDYRNALLHGRVRPEFQIQIPGPVYGQQARVTLYPKLETIASALDWRDATLNQAMPAEQLIDEVWAAVLDYARTTWETKLVPWARDNFRAPGTPEGISSLFLPNVAGARSVSAEGPPPPSGESASFSETHLSDNS
jgi:hypothetical protein